MGTLKIARLNGSLRDILLGSIIPFCLGSCARPQRLPHQHLENDRSFPKKTQMLMAVVHGCKVGCMFSKTSLDLRVSFLESKPEWNLSDQASSRDL